MQNKIADLKVDATYSILEEDKDHVYVQMGVKYTPPQINKDILIVLDVSGSMRGSPIKICKDVLEKLVEYMHDECKNHQHNLITFHLEATFQKMEDFDTQKCLDVIKDIQADGGTAFKPVLEEIRSYVLSKKAPELCIILLSDGQAEKLYELTEDMNKIKEFLASNTTTSEFHVIGLGAHHDAPLLTAFTTLGSLPGSFNYVEGPNKIPNCMNAISGFFKFNVLSAAVELPSLRENSRSYTQILLEDRNSKEGEDQVKCKGIFQLQINPNDFEEHKDKLMVSFKCGAHRLDKAQLLLEKSEIKDPQTILSLTLEGYKRSLEILAEKLKADELDTEQINKVDEQIKMIREEMTKKFRAVLKVPLSERDSTLR